MHLKLTLACEQFNWASDIKAIAKWSPIYCRTYMQEMEKQSIEKK